MKHGSFLVQRTPKIPGVCLNFLWVNRKKTPTTSMWTSSLRFQGNWSGTTTFMCPGFRPCSFFFLVFCNCTIILKFRHIVANPFCLDLWSRWFMVDFRERWKMVEIYYPFEGEIDSLSSGGHHFLFLLTGQTRMSILSPVHHHDRDFCWSFEPKTNKSKVDKQLLTPHLFTIEHEGKQVLHFFNPSDIWPLKLGTVGPNFPTSLGCFYSYGGFTNKNGSLTTKIGI